MDTDLATYQDLVRAASVLKLGMNIYNDKTEHARALVSALVETAEEQILAFVGSPRTSFFRETCEELLKALDANPDLDVRLLIGSDAPSDGAPLECLPEGVSCEYIGTSGDRNHFVAVDGRAYRFEAAHVRSDDVDEIDTKAVANFNDPDFARRLRKYFEILSRDAA